MSRVRFADDPSSSEPVNDSHTNTLYDARRSLFDADVEPIAGVEAVILDVVAAPCIPEDASPPSTSYDEGNRNSESAEDGILKYSTSTPRANGTSTSAGAIPAPTPIASPTIHARSRPAPPPRTDDYFTPLERGCCSEWIVAHPWLWRCVLLLLALGLVAVAVVPAVCLTVGCAPKHEAEEEPPASLRLLVRYRPDLATSSQQLMPLLSKFFNTSRLNSSGLEVLAFSDAALLGEVRRLLTKQYADKLDLLIADFPMALPSTPEDLRGGPGSGGVTLPSVLAGAVPGDANGAAAAAAAAAATAAAAAGAPARRLTQEHGKGSAAGPGLQAERAAGLRGGQQAAAGGPERRSNQELEVEEGAGAGPAGGADSGPDPLLGQQWHLAAVRAGEAWATTAGVAEVVVAVVDTGVDLSHPDLVPSLWVNPGEIPGNGVDDDGNGYVDDVHGYDFAGPCSSDWRSVPSPPPPPPPPPRPASAPPSPPPSPVPPPGPPRPRPPPPRPRPRPPPPRNRGRRRGLQQGNVTGDAAASGDGAAGVSLPAAEQAWKPGRCGSDGDPSPEGVDRGHGTHVAGLVAAARGNGRGGSGLAPGVRIMVLKVADPNGQIWTSNVVAAYDYAVRMGAHVVQCSFGPAAPLVNPSPADVARSRVETQVYERAVQPMMRKGALLVAAAGNEDTDLDSLRAAGTSYLPCTLDLPNVVCVAATDLSGAPWRELVANRWVGSNTGPSSVDLAAPGARLLSTSLGGGYEEKTGSSMAAPLVSAAAALVLSLLGAADGNFFQADRAKAILLETGDPRPRLPVITQRSLNAARAVAAAAAAASSGATLLVPLPYDVAAQSAVLSRSLAESYYRLPPATVAALAAAEATAGGGGGGGGGGGVELSTVGLTAFGSGTRAASSQINAPYKYSGADVLLAVRGHLYLPYAGLYGVRLSTAVSLARIVVSVGERALAWPAAAEADGSRQLLLQAPQAGWYALELLYADPGPFLVLAWAPPGLGQGAAREWRPLPDGWLGLGSLGGAAEAQVPYAPPFLPDPAAKPSGYQILWRPDPRTAGGSPNAAEDDGLSQSNATSGTLPYWDPGFLSTLDPNGFYPYSVFADDLSVIAPTVFTNGPTANGSLVALLSGGGGTDSGAPAAATAAAAAAGTAVYGMALAFVRPPPTGQALQFRVTCSFCSLHLGGQLLLEVAGGPDPGSQRPTTRLSPCTRLVAASPAPSPAAASEAALPLQLRFAARNASASALGLQWAPCASAVGPAVDAGINRTSSNGNSTTAGLPPLANNSTQVTPPLPAFASLAPRPPSPGPGYGYNSPPPPYGFSSLATLMAGTLWYRAQPAPPAPPAAVSPTVSAPGSMAPGSMAPGSMAPGSMACDVWSEDAVTSTSPGQVTVLPRRDLVPPGLAFRLPHPNASTAPCLPLGSFCPAGATLTFRLSDIYPQLSRAVPLGRFFVRCWGWWGGSFPGGLLAVRSAASLDTAVYLGGQRVFYSLADSPDNRFNRLPTAPTTTVLGGGSGGGGYRQLLAVEWHGVFPAARLSLVAGTTNTSSSAVPSLAISADLTAGPAPA